MGKKPKQKLLPKGVVKRVNTRLLKIMRMNQDELWAYLAFEMLPRLRIPFVVQRTFLAIPGTVDVGMMAHLDTSKPVGPIEVDPGTLVLSLRREVNKELAKRAIEMEKEWDALKVDYSHAFPSVSRRYQTGRDGAYSLWVYDREAKESYPLEEYKKANAAAYAKLEAAGMVSSVEEKELQLGFTFNDISEMKRKAGLSSYSANYCLGGDDRAGVYACLCMLRLKKRPTIILTTDEEVGCVGARAFVERGPTLAPAVHQRLQDAKAFIQIDRRNHNDCVFYNQEQMAWVKYIESFGFVHTTGSTSDVRHIAKAYGVCGVNLSAGFLNEHGESETLSYRTLCSTIRKTMRLVADLAREETKWVLNPDPIKPLTSPSHAHDEGWYGEEEEEDVAVIDAMLDAVEKKKKETKLFSTGGTRGGSRIYGRPKNDSLERHTEMMREMKAKQRWWYITGNQKYSGIPLTLMERKCHFCGDPMFILIHFPYDLPGIETVDPDTPVFSDAIVFADANYGTATTLSIPYFAWDHDQDYRICQACRLWYLYSTTKVV